MTTRSALVLGFGIGSLCATTGRRISGWVVDLAVAARKAGRPLI